MGFEVELGGTRSFFLGIQHLIPGGSQALQNMNAGTHLIRVIPEICLHKRVDAEGIDAKEIFGDFSPCLQVKTCGELREDALSLRKVFVLGRDVSLLDSRHTPFAVADSRII